MQSISSGSNLTMDHGQSMHNQNKQIAGFKQQIGTTLLGTMLVIASLGFVGFVGIKVLPAYKEYYSVNTVLHVLNKESLSSMSKSEIQASFDKRASINNVTSVKGADLVIDKNTDGKTVISAEYQVITPLFSNVSILINFSSSNDGQ